MKTGKDVEKLMGRKWATWGEFKHALVRAEIIKSFYEDCPPEWLNAYVMFSGRATVKEGRIKLASFIREDAPKSQYKLSGGLTFDVNNGLGAVSDNSNVVYLGFVAWMKPSEFLKLNPARQDTLSPEAIKAHEAGTPVAPPFLSVKWMDKYWQVKGHEGRGRAQLIMKKYGDILIPIHIFPRDGLRARHMTPQHLKASFHGDGTSAVVLPSKIEHEA